MLLFLAIVDFLAAAALLLVFFGLPVIHYQAGAALLLLLKGAFFFYDLLSIIDVAVAILMFVMLWVQLPKLALGLAVYLIIKGLYSLS